MTVGKLPELGPEPVWRTDCMSLRRQLHICAAIATLLKTHVLTTTVGGSQATIEHSKKCKALQIQLEQ